MKGEDVSKNGRYLRGMDVDTHRILKSDDVSLSHLTNIGDIQSGYIEKAVSSMQKDSILHEYQYFVGNSNTNN